MAERTPTRNIYRALGQISMALVRLRGGDLAGAEADARAAHATMLELVMRAYFPHAQLALLRVLTRCAPASWPRCPRTLGCESSRK